MFVKVFELPLVMQGAEVAGHMFRSQVGFSFGWGFAVSTVRIVLCLPTQVVQLNTSIRYLTISTK